MSGTIMDVHIHPFGVLSEDQLLAELNEAAVKIGVLLALDTDPSDLDMPDDNTIERFVINTRTNLHTQSSLKVVVVVDVYTKSPNNNFSHRAASRSRRSKSYTTLFYL